MRDFNRLVRDLKRQPGITVEQGRNCHYKVYRGRQLIVVLPATSVSRTGLKNKLAVLKKAGLV
jgi:hypothetical protein